MDRKSHLEWKVIALNETLSKFQDYAKDADVEDRHYSLWTAGIVTSLWPFLEALPPPLFPNSTPWKSKQMFKTLREKLRKKLRQLQLLRHRGFKKCDFRLCFVLLVNIANSECCFQPFSSPWLTSTAQHNNSQLSSWAATYFILPATYLFSIFI